MRTRQEKKINELEGIIAYQGPGKFKPGNDWINIQVEHQWVDSLPDAQHPVRRALLHSQQSGGSCYGGSQQLRGSAEHGFAHCDKLGMRNLACACMFI